MFKIGFIVNPYSGLGGEIGLKGSDGVRELLQTINLDSSRAVQRASMFINALVSLGTSTKNMQIYTMRGYMGEKTVNNPSIKVSVLNYPDVEPTISMHTVLSVKYLYESGVDVLVFVGGDGTARDIYIGLKHYGGLDLPVLGVPSGVKMFSGVFSNRPSDAARLINMYMGGEADLVDGEVLDVDEYAYRGDELKLKYFGSLKVISGGSFLQPSKDISASGGEEEKVAIAKYVVENMEDDAVYILGPGSTVKAVADVLGVSKTLLGVDVYCKKYYMKDVAEPDLWRLVNREDKVYLILSPIGRQGFILGRGNLQISPRVLRKIGKGNILVLATRQKLSGLEGGVLRIDTGDPELDDELRGFYKVIVGYREYRYVKAL